MPICAMISAFASAGQTRRLPAPVKISIRRAGSDIGLRPVSGICPSPDAPEHRSVTDQPMRRKVRSGTAYEARTAELISRLDTWPFSLDGAEAMRIMDNALGDSYPTDPGWDF